MKCFYCNNEDDEMFVVKKLVAPRHTPHCWKRIGYCCVDCNTSGKPVRIEETK